MNEIKQFTFFRNYYDVIKELPNKEEFAFSILEYVFEDRKPQFNGLNKGIWQLIERPLQISKNKSQNAKKEKQKEIKSKSNENQTHYSISSSISNSNSKKEKDNRDMGEEEKEKKPKNKFGEYQNVLLTEKEYESLQKAYSNYEELIKFLDEYIEDKGYKSKSHYLAIKRWVVQAVNEKQNKQIKSSNPFREIAAEEGLI